MISRTLCMALGISFLMGTANTQMALGATTLKKDDLATASGFLYTGVNEGIIKGVLLSPGWYAQLQPDKWDSIDEGKAWGSWYDKFGQSLGNAWRSAAVASGQQTLKIAVLPNKEYKVLYGGTTLGEKTLAQEQFDEQVKRVLTEALKNSPELPQTKNALCEFRFSVTLGADEQQFPKFSASDFRVVARKNSGAGDLVVYFVEPAAGIRPISSDVKLSTVAMKRAQFKTVATQDIRAGKAEATGESKK